MRNKVLILHSGLRTTQRLLDKCSKSFPELEFVPIAFENTGKKNSVPEDIGEYVGCYCTFMTGDKVYFIKQLPDTIPLIWGIPGGDLYNRYLRYFGYELCHDERTDFLFKIGSIFRKVHRRKEFEYLMNRCSAILSAHCDFNMILKYKTKSSRTPQWIPSVGYYVKKMLGDLYGLPLGVEQAVHIAIGNSASRTNNHLYVLKRLKSKAIGDARLSLMMSYGDSDAAYKENVFSRYKTWYGDRVTFITDYMYLDEYNKLLSSFSHFIYGNWRQEAVGNIMTALYLGGKVYMSNRNPLLNDFREQGYIIFELEKADNSFLQPLSLEDKIHNRKLIEANDSQNRIELFRNYLAPYFLKE